LDGYENAHADANRDRYPHGDGYSHRNAHLDAHENAHLYAHGDGHAYGNADTDGDEHAPL
jgi:hypothetical protein